MAFSLFVTIVRLHIMNYVSIAAIIEAYKLKRKRKKKEQTFKPALKKSFPCFAKEKEI
jgi:hypothetical protein